MTTGTISPYLELPEDINPPKPGYFHDVFHLVNAYLELLRNIPENAVPSRGLIKLYGLRMGTLDIDTTFIESKYLSLLNSNHDIRNKLQLFAHSSIAFNIQALYQLITNTISRDLVRGFGDDKCLSMETVHALNQFAKFQHKHHHDGPRNQREDNMDSLVETVRYNAIYRHDGVTSSEAIIRAIAVLDTIVHGNEHTPVTPEYSLSQTARWRARNALKIVFYIGCRFYHLNVLRFSDEIINRSYDRILKITDLTLAAVPFDPTLIYNTGDETSSISKWGIEYVQSLEAVLLYFGGIRYEALLAIDANGNKGVLNV